MVIAVSVVVVVTVGLVMVYEGDGLAVDVVAVVGDVDGLDGVVVVLLVVIHRGSMVSVVDGAPIGMVATSSGVLVVRPGKRELWEKH